MGKVATTRITKSGGSLIIRIPKSIVGIYDVDPEKTKLEWFIGFDREIEKFAGDEAVVIRFAQRK